MKFFKYSLFIIAFVIFSCSNDDTTPNNPTNPTTSKTKELTIFHINDQHGSIENFSKIKYLVDAEKANTNVLLVCSGDIFSGNPVVDNYTPKGYPMIDLMNKVGFDIAVLGNHEFDYGEAILKDRLLQANFSWVCANVSMNETGIPQPFEYKTIVKNDVKVTFLGLVETYGKEGATIPSTHPWRVENLTFENYANVIANYANVKAQEGADLYIALTHLGENIDTNIAYAYPYFDVIIGGHSHTITNTVANNIPIYQAGSNLNYIGKLKLTIKDQKIDSFIYELIDLNNVTNYDSDIQTAVNNFNNEVNLNEVIGYANAYHNKSAVGTFYTDALRQELNVDFSIQNTGGVRNVLDEGDITKGEIYSIDPFNNGSVTYTMTVEEIKNFLKDSKIAIYYAGIILEQQNESIVIKNLNQQVLNDNTTLTIGLNDYIPAVYDLYFQQTPTVKPYTTAETIINYFNHHSENIDYTASPNYFRYE